MKRIETLLNELLKDPNRVGRIITPEASDRQMYAAYRIANSGVTGSFEGTAIDSIQAEIALFGKSIKMGGKQETKELLELSRNVISRILNDVNAESIQLNESFETSLKRPVVTILFLFKGNQ